MARALRGAVHCVRSCVYVTKHRKVRDHGLRRWIIFGLSVVGREGSRLMLLTIYEDVLAEHEKIMDVLDAYRRC